MPAKPMHLNTISAVQQAGVVELEKDALQQDLQRLENRFRYFIMNQNTAYHARSR
jgi:hypothetical protein